MPTSNARVEIHLGNIEGRMVGPAPRGALDRALNPHLVSAAHFSPDGREQNYAQVFDPRAQTFLIGALSQAKRVLRREGVRFRVRDRRSRLAVLRRHQWELCGPPLRDYQREVVESALASGRGIIDIGTGGGKTLLAAAIIARLGLPTLYLVTTRPLLEQTVEHLTSYLQDLDLGVIGDGVHRPRELTVALVQALTRPETDLSRWKDGCLVFDEGHHACAPTYLELVKRVDARCNYFLSAVPFRSGEDQVVLDTLTGGSLTGRRFSAKYLIDNGYACPADVQVEYCRITAQTAELPFTMVYERAIVHNRTRNERITDIANRHLWRGASILILVDRIRHGQILVKRVRHAAFVHGGTPKRKLRTLTERFRSGDLPCLIATAGLFQEGVDIHGINVLIQAGGMKSRTRTLQAIGRGLRKAEGKDRVLFVDFLDDDSASSGILREHSLRRLGALRSEGFFVATPDKGQPAPPAKSEIEPSWHHVEGTKKFLLVGSTGAILAQKECVQPQVVPEKCCRSCPQKAACRKEE